MSKSMNRRNFLRNVAMTTIGAAGLVVVPGRAAQQLLDEGETIIREDNILGDGSIITPEKSLEDIVDASRFGDNLADILLHSSGSVTFMRDPMFGDQNTFRAFGKISSLVDFKQDGIYKIYQGGTRSAAGMRYRGRR